MSILSPKMAEGDIILLQTIKKLFPENEENFTKLGDFTTDFVLEVTAKLLNVIHSPDKPFKNVKPPSTYLLSNYARSFVFNPEMFTNGPNVFKVLN